MFLLRFYILACFAICLQRGEVFAQEKNQYQTYLAQGQSYEEQGQYKKALEAYQSAKSQAPESYKPIINRLITQAEDELEKQKLSNLSRAEKIKTELSEIEDVKKRTDLQHELSKLRQNEETTKEAYERLARRVKAAKQVEEELKKTEPEPTDIDKPGGSGLQSSRSSKQNRAIAATEPPPKTITRSNPSATSPVKKNQNTTKSAPKINN